MARDRVLGLRDNQYAAETARLRDMARESRLRAVDSKLSVSFTLCAVAETHIRYARSDEAHDLVSKLRHFAETIRIHINEPNHVPTVAIADLRLRLTQLEKQIEKIEFKLHQHELRSA